MKKKSAPLILIMALSLLLPFAQAEAAVSNGTSGATASSSSANNSSPKTRAGSVNQRMRSYMKQSASQRYLNKSSQFNAIQRTLPSSALYKGSIKRTLNQNPAGSAFLNYYFPYWMIFHGGGYTAEQKNILRSAGIKEKALFERKEKRYWLLIEDQNGKEHAVLVSKKQYDSIQKGDRIEVRRKQITKK
ncbi:hypothetical protein MOF05_08620 [Bacillus haynesii]|uniref:hypothetical protein n=1 Tax=Bacillus haynesii TaxID=1925021 RepID=UPI00228205D6|nr:hypothetical protein [Bacillus haynesii]MCY7755053.1 hypothetical protein [Bacillus haynesii]MCY9288454.1 hypothetical protein [Bacillus haynesii]MEC0700495.1 hypothetical protein [Bacillus haynesii]